jgi:two-component system, NtrC family, sensor kinase
MPPRHGESGGISSSRPSIPKVLFVDDDESSRLACKATCGDDFDVLTAPSGAAALQLMRTHEVGVLVSDRRMPNMSGVDLLERAAAEFPDTVRVLATAYSDVHATADAINRGRVSRYLEKPWDTGELRAALTDALEHYSTSRRVKALERRLVQTERVYALGIVAAGIGHELRNPISWISTNLEHALGELAALRSILPGAAAELASAKLQDIREALEDANSGAERVIEIISAIQLSMLRPSNESELVDLEEVVRLALRLVGGELRRAARVELEVDVSPKVSGSRAQLSQIVVNLLVNAIHAVSNVPASEAVVGVRISFDGRLGYLEVADCGPGVPDQDTARIFDPFFTTKPGVGTGLGLAISRRIAGELGGSLEIARDARLGGAVFRLILPAQLAH